MLHSRLHRLHLGVAFIVLNCGVRGLCGIGKEEHPSQLVVPSIDSQCLMEPELFEGGTGSEAK